MSNKKNYKGLNNLDIKDDMRTIVDAIDDYYPVIAEEITEKTDLIHQPSRWEKFKGKFKKKAADTAAGMIDYDDPTYRAYADVIAVTAQVIREYNDIKEQDPEFIADLLTFTIDLTETLQANYSTEAEKQEAIQAKYENLKFFISDHELILGDSMERIGAVVDHKLGLDQHWEKFKTEFFADLPALQDKNVAEARDQIINKFVENNCETERDKKSAEIVLKAAFDKLSAEHDVPLDSKVADNMAAITKMEAMSVAEIKNLKNTGVESSKYVMPELTLKDISSNNLDKAFGLLDNVTKILTHFRDQIEAESAQGRGSGQSV